MLADFTANSFVIKDRALFKDPVLGLIGAFRSKGELSVVILLYSEIVSI
jgi:hypothetical protein